MIAIVNTWSDINPCHTHFKQRVEEVKRGVWQAGGFPVEMPAMSLSEPFQKPTTMLYRNLLAMETEELLRSLPGRRRGADGRLRQDDARAPHGRDRMDLPAIFMPAGPMLRGDWRGEPLGSGSDVWKYWAELRAGNITEDDWREIEERHRALARALHDDGHRLDDDERRRSARPHAAGRGVDPGRRLAPRADGDAHAAGASSRWCGRI